MTAIVKFKPSRRLSPISSMSDCQRVVGRRALSGPVAGTIVLYYDAASVSARHE